MHLRYMPPSNCNLINSNCWRSFPNSSWLLPSNVMPRTLPGALPNALHILTIRYTTFPLTWPAAWCNCIGTEDWFGTPTWSLFHWLGTPIWRKWRHVKTLFSEGSFLLKKTKYTPRQHLVTYWTQRSHKIWKIAVFCKVQDTSFPLPWRILNWVKVGGHQAHKRVYLAYPACIK